MSSSQILYIQMEFCPRTLADVLEAGALEPADAWNVFRCLLAGVDLVELNLIVVLILSSPLSVFFPFLRRVSFRKIHT